MQTPDLEPKQGSSATLVARLRAYLEAFDPEGPLRWRGADEEEIAEYARLCEIRAGRQLPVSYLTYLRSLGQSNGDLFGDFKLVTELPRLIKLYRGASELEPFSPDFPVCGTYVIGDQISLDMREQGEPPVVETTNGIWYSALSKSWEALVMQAAIKRVEARRLPLCRWFSRSRDGLERALGKDDVVQKMQALLEHFGESRGMHRMWASDAMHHILICERHCLYTRGDASGAVIVNIFTSEQSFLDEVQSQLEPSLGAGKSGRAGLVDGRLTDLGK